MRYIYTLLLAVLCTLSVQAQNYYVLHVKGSIYNKSAKKKVSVGDQITNEHQIQFGSKDAVAMLINSKRGKFLIKPKVNASTDSELSYHLKNIVQPKAQNMQLSTRGMMIFNNVANLRAYFKEDKRLFVVKERVLPIFMKDYPVDKEHSFYLSYEYNGKVVNKLLKYNEDGIILNRSELLTIGDEYINADQIQNVALHYYNHTEKTSTTEPLCVIDLSLPSSHVLKNQYSIFRELYESQENLKDAFEAFLEETYGRFDEKDVDNLDLK